MNKDPGLPVYATLREGDGETHIECRFADGQKYAAVVVAEEYEMLAAFILGCLNPFRAER